MKEDEAYTAAMAELRAKNVSEGVWAKALAFSDGDAAKAKSAYLRFRADQLMREPKPKTSVRLPNLGPNRDGVSIVGDSIVVPEGYIFPHLCVLSGVHSQELPEATRLKKVPVWFYLTVFIHPAVFLLFYWFVRETGVVALCIDASVRKEKIWRKWTMTGFCIITICLPMVGYYYGGPSGYLSTFLPFAALTSWFYIRHVRGVYLVKKKKGTLFIGGIPRHIMEEIFYLGSPAPHDRAKI